MIGLDLITAYLGSGLLVPERIAPALPSGILHAEELLDLHEQAPADLAQAIFPFLDRRFYADRHGVPELDALHHFASVGFEERLDPHPLVDLPYIAERLTAQGAGPLTPDLFFRLLKGNAVDPSPYFDAAWYQLQVDRPLLSPSALVDFLLKGAAEGRAINPYLDAAAYAASHADVPNDPLGAICHFVTVGDRTGRSPGPAFEAAFPARGETRALRAVLQERRSEGSTRAREERATYDPTPAEMAAEHRAMTARLRTEEASAAQAAHRVLAFYLPQFHPFTENDVFWGRGFTEWTNVTRARPSFPGHYQPRLPGELGFYDLRNPETLEAQQALARAHGVDGFVMYYYNFGHAKPMSDPLQMLRDRGDLDFSFCLCWANENWTRHWDGGSVWDVLLEQDYRPDLYRSVAEDAVAAARLPGAIQVDGKPLFILYRPLLLPDLDVAVDIWRKAFAEAGFDGVHLAYVAGMEAVHSDLRPEDLGFDSAIQFPPHGRSVPLKEQPDGMKPSFAGKLYDYDRTVTAFARDQEAGTITWPGVFPGWDNAARQPDRHSSFLGATPPKFQAAVEASLARLDRTHPEGGLLFVNAWNEWAEGAHLEPDQLHGRDALQAVRNAHLGRGTAASAGPEEVAVIIHAFYPDVLQDLLKRLSATDLPVHLFVSSPPEVEDEVAAALNAAGLPFEHHVAENRGRDVLPFLSMLPRVQAAGFTWFLKLHTKRSTHRQDGDTWRDSLMDRLIEPEIIRACALHLTGPNDIGLIGPEKHLVSIDFYLSSNVERCAELSERMGHAGFPASATGGFFAGTMFFARTAALKPLLDLGLTAEDFEAEQGQLDGTTAHAIERLLPISAEVNGFRVRTIEHPDNDAALDPAETYEHAAPTPRVPT